MGSVSPYCVSRFHSTRRTTREVKIGELTLGGKQPVRVQSMTTTDTMDTRATARQSIELAEAGCEIVRITAPNLRAAEALKEISREVRAAKIEVPLVADIHFMPQAAMEAAKYVEKVESTQATTQTVRNFKFENIPNPNTKKNWIACTIPSLPWYYVAKNLGRAMRIGTNHGSLSDRIMNRFGDSPRGMAESALEFLRIARSHQYHEMVLSMKSSNPKVMIEAYRLVVSLMNNEGMDYPLHLGVTEAGDGEDARIKSAIGIGSLLLDGLGDTLRVSLTEDPVAEIPVARDLANRAHLCWESKDQKLPDPIDFVDPYLYRRRPCPSISLNSKTLEVGEKSPPSVLVSTPHRLDKVEEIIGETARSQSAAKDAPIEGLIVSLENSSALPDLEILRDSLFGAVSVIVVDDLREDPCTELPPIKHSSPPLLWHAAAIGTDESEIARFLAHCESAGHHPCISLPGVTLSSGIELLLNAASSPPLSPCKQLHRGITQSLLTEP